MDRAGVIVSEMGEFSKVKLVRHTACGNCGACQLGDDQKDIMLIAKNTVHAKMGDLVEVSMATNSVLSAAFIMYIIPLGGLFIGLLLGQWLFPSNEIIIALLGVGMMTFSYAMIKLNDKHFSKNDKYVAHIMAVVQSAHEDMVPLS